MEGTINKVGSLNVQKFLALSDKPNLIDKYSMNKTDETLGGISIGNNRHYYLGDQNSFVLLGPNIYKGSITDALMAGEIGYIENKLLSGEIISKINDSIDGFTFILDSVFLS